MLLHLREEVSFHDGVDENLARHVLLKLELVTDAQQFVLLAL